nr:DUF4833 domain-containing protein [Pontibacter silvestris]
MLCCLRGTEATASDTVLVNVQDTLPVPKGIRNMMFYVQRDPNANTVVYELNLLEQGIPDEKDPIHPFWIRYADGGERKELNYIQRKFAYGLNSKKLGKDSYELKFVCYSKLPLYLRKGTNGKFHVYATINDKQAILNRIFVRIEGGTFWVPNVLYFELKGTDAVTGKVVSERFKP